MAIQYRTLITVDFSHGIEGGNTVINIEGLGIKESNIFLKGKHNKETVEKFLKEVANGGEFPLIRERLLVKFGNSDSEQETLSIFEEDDIDGMVP